MQGASDKAQSEGRWKSQGTGAYQNQSKFVQKENKIMEVSKCQKKEWL